VSDPTIRRLTDVRALEAAIASLVGTPTSVTRVEGGTKKGVYRVALEHGTTAIAYSWDESENYWKTSADETEPFTEASGQQLFLRAHAALEERGVRTLTVLGQTDGLVVVEDLTGGTLEQSMVRAPGTSPNSLVALATMLEQLHSDRTTLIGKLGTPIPGAKSCAQIAYERALRHLAEARNRHVDLGPSIEGQLDDAISQVDARTTHALIHGELGPDHVLLDREGTPVLIDIEGLMHFDLEWEHAFMRIRFGAASAQLEPADLDENRLRLYTLCLRLSLIAGPLRLLDGDFPDRESMIGIVTANLAALQTP
jgi:hypothetical protein